MKRNKYTNLFGWLAAAMLLLTTSCKDDLLGSGQSDEVTVTFTIAPEGVASTRAVDYGNGPQISDGTKADKLIYAVYGPDGTLLKQYGEDGEDGNGQTVITDIEKFPYTLSLTLKRGVQYTIAFWAQSSKTNAYKTDDLKKVEVIYSEVEEELAGGTGNGEDEPKAADEQGDNDALGTTTLNNDEFRDAFCRSVTFMAGSNEGGLDRNIYLYRPLAQINVGTSGFDFESITRNSEKKYLYSKIRLNRVARYLDVVADKTITSTTNDDTYGEDGGEKTAESFAVVDFGYAPIPAYVNWEEKGTDTKWANYPDYPQYPSYTVWDWDYDVTYKYPHTEEGKSSEDMKAYYTGEEFLKVHLYKDKDEEIKADDNGVYKDNAGNIYTAKGGDGYRQYANLTNHNNELSETFKYLSMCYVLTSSTKDDLILINNVKMWMATDKNGADEVEVLNLNNVPAQRNWRTNIVGNLLTEDMTFVVELDRNFAGEYNGIYDGENADWSGYLWDGVYYDAKNDEIQISNANGLIWFQKMVNGTLKVRDAKNTQHIDLYYPYYEYKESADGTISKETHRLKYDGIAMPDDATVRERILIATHQKYNSNSQKEGTNGWPKNNNFHFTGKDENGNDYPAKVKLMADIDLEGIDWIPIGYDVKVHDTSAMDKNDGKRSYMDFDETDGTQRAFCGIFDGNGHTISNLKNKRFTAYVHEEAEQETNAGPYDNLQWFPSGFFGMISGNAKIKNLRLVNVDIYGYHTAAAVAAIVNSKDGTVDITDCYVDGGTITLSPMYRGDTHKASLADPRNRTFARGIYLGGIVGQYVANGEITGCNVRNVALRGYRQIGGLVGSVSNQEQIEKGEWPNDKNLDAKIYDNKISNLLIVANKFQPYDSICSMVSPFAPSVWKNGFGWVESQASRANYYVGGTVQEIYTNNSGKETAQFTEFSTEAKKESTSRKAEIGNVPLQYIPMLSSWFCDEITLASNYYGKTGVYTDRNYHKFAPYNVKHAGKSESYAETFRVPFRLPYSLEVDYNTNSAPAAMYVESVTLDGIAAFGGRSVITPEGVNLEGACVMYVTSRDRKQFFDENNGYVWYPTSATLEKLGYKKEDYAEAYKKPTIIKNVVLRGAPYAWTGMLFAPNENMSEVKLYNVAIYDVYKTLAFDDENAGKTDADVHVPLTVEKSNLRGYTVPGKGWSLITYIGTTFEEGTSTGHEKESTYEAEAATTFKGCFFKAPYTIDLSKAKLNGKTVSFSENSEPKDFCYATAISTNNKKISLTDDDKKADATHIVISSNAKGDPVVKYYKGEILDDDDHLLVTEE